jgi:hypothetical protein
MHEAVEHLMRALLIGAGATAFMDVAMAARKRLLDVPAPDSVLVGRWLAWEK